MTDHKNAKSHTNHSNDHYEKKFIDLNDIFADIINTLIFNGEERIKEEDLTSAMTRSAYTVDGLFAEQERDSKKFWKNSSVNIAILGIENQTAEDPELSIRTLAYDGADYRDQLRHRAEIRRKNQKLVKEKKEPEPVPELYPVVTLVLYFGDKRWSGSLSLKDHLNIPEGLEPYVQDYKINLFEISYLNVETVRSFKSDFRFVAEYFVSTQRAKDGLDPIFEVTADHLRHVEEFIDLMNSLTKTRRFDALKGTITRGGELPMMTYMFDEAEARGKAAGIAEGEAKGRAEGRAEGKAEGEAMFIRLTEKLLSLGKIEDLQKATTDRLFKEKLYKEYQISGQ